MKTCTISATVAFLGMLSGTVVCAAWQDISTANSPLPSDQVNTIIVGISGRVWICTTQGLAYEENGKIVPQPVKDGQGRERAVSIWTVFEQGADKVWVGHSQGAVCIEGGTQTWHDHGQAQPARYVDMGKQGLWCVASTYDGHKKVQRFNGRVWETMHFDRGRIRPADPELDAKSRTLESFDQRSGIVGTRIVDIYVAPDGRVWLSVDGNGVIELNPTKGLDTYSHHLAKLNVTAVFMDSTGTMWFGLWSRGVARYAEGKIVYLLERELARCAVMHVCEDKQGGILVSTNMRGLWSRPKGSEKWSNELPDAGSITLLEVTADGRVWIGAQGFGGLKVWDGNKWTVGYDSAMPMRSLTQTRDGAIWVGGVLDGVHVLRTGKE